MGSCWGKMQRPEQFARCPSQEPGEIRGEHQSLSPGTAALAAQGGADAGVGEQENGGLGMAAGRNGCRNTPESPLGEAVTRGWGIGRGLVGASQEP